MICYQRGRESDMAKSCLAFPANFTAVQWVGALGLEREWRQGWLSEGRSYRARSGMLHREVMCEQVSKVKYIEHLSP